MNNIKTIADFKRAMVIGSTWETTHKYTDNNPTLPKNMGIRECGKIQSNCFAFINPESGQLSYCNWPKKTEFSTRDNGNIVVITTSFCELTYRECV